MIQQSPQLFLFHPTSGRRVDVTAEMWPGYQRESLAIGGDFRASSAFGSKKADAWPQYLGWYFEERWGGVVTFKGRLFTIVINQAGSIYAISLENVWNAVRTRYLEDALDDSPELIGNGGFETADPYGTNTFDEWGELGTDGSIAQSGATSHSGSYSAAITAGASTDIQVGRTISVREGEIYDWVFWTRGDGTYDGRYEIFNNNTNTNIVSLTATGVTGTTWTEKTVQFTAPAGCSSISIRLRCPSTNGGVAYFDDVSLKQYLPTEFDTSWYTDDESIRLYGRRERIVEPRVLTDTSGAQALAQAVLARYAWPENEPQELASGRVDEAKVSVMIQGHVQSLKNEHYDGTSTTLVDADSAISTTLAASSGVISAGDIRANSSVQVTGESDAEAIWSRLAEIASFGDGSDQYLIGCYASAKLDYKPINRKSISYYAEMDTNGKLHYFDRSNREIAGALLKPGTVIWRRDLRPGEPRSTPYTDDTRATLIGSIRLQRGDVRIEALDLNEKIFLNSLINSIDLEV